MADVICPSCNMRPHVTTDSYRSGVPTTGDMLTLKQKYIDNGWESFYEDKTCPPGDIACPECGALYAEQNGEVRIVEEKGRKNCPVCKKSYTSQGITNHIKYTHPEYVDKGLQP